MSSIGRADVVHEGLVWEVKHAGANRINRTTEAWAQAITYQIFNKEITGLGAAGAFDGYFYIGCEGNAYLVSYDTPASGAILYTVSPVQNYTGQYYAVFIPSTNKQEEIEQGLQLLIVGGGCMLVAGCLPGGGHSSYDTKNMIF